MVIELKNIGMIKEAKVKLEGLTVIAGENDTGKSTVGKVIFSIVKGMQKYEENIGKKIDDIVEKISKILIDLTLKNILEKETNEEKLKLFQLSLKKLEEDNLNLNEFLEIVKKIENGKIQYLVNDLEKLYLKDEKGLKEEALRRAFFSEFKNQLIFKDEKEALIKFIDNEELEIKIEDNKFILKDEVELSVKDVTLIESPIILNFTEMIIDAISYFEEGELRNKKELMKIRPDVVYHSKDLINKLVNSSKYGREEIDEELLNILKFDFEYKETTREFVYLKDGVEYHSLNVADGIKSFGIIKLLLKGGFITKDDLLVIDEPEVHLHPKWQIEFAKVIVELVKRNIKVLITSHSPYMIEALEVFSHRKKIKNNFYLAEDNRIEEQETIENIFKKLVEPIRDLKRYRIENL